MTQKVVILTIFSCHINASILTDFFCQNNKVVLSVQPGRFSTLQHYYISTPTLAFCFMFFSTGQPPLLGILQPFIPHLHYTLELCQSMAKISIAVSYKGAAIMLILAIKTEPGQTGTVLKCQCSLNRVLETKTEFFLQILYNMDMKQQQL